MTKDTVCLFCGMTGASMQLSGEPWAIHQYACGTVQCIIDQTGEVITNQQSPACKYIMALQEELETMRYEFLEEW